MKDDYRDKVIFIGTYVCVYIKRHLFVRKVANIEGYLG